MIDRKVLILGATSSPHLRIASGLSIILAQELKHTEPSWEERINIMAREMAEAVDAEILQEIRSRKWFVCTRYTPKRKCGPRRRRTVWVYPSATGVGK